MKKSLAFSSVTLSPTRDVFGDFHLGGHERSKIAAPQIPLRKKKEFGKNHNVLKLALKRTEVARNTKIPTAIQM
jgi:hypothetical protein